MSFKMSPRRFGLFGATVACLVLAACSSGSTATAISSPGLTAQSHVPQPGSAAAVPAISASAASGTPEARAFGGTAAAAVQSAQLPIGSFQAPGPKFDSSPAKGKSVWVLTPFSVPFAATALSGMKQAAAEVGVKITGFDTKAQPNLVNEGIQQAIAAKANAIMIVALPVTLFATAIAKAHSANIPVISIENHDPGPLPTGTPEGVVASVDLCHACAGRLMAQYVLSQDPTPGTVVVFKSSDSPGIGNPQQAAITQTFQEACGSKCPVDVIDAPIATWATRMQSTTQAALTSHPTSRWFLPMYDGMVPFMMPAINAAGKASSVHVVSFNATPAVMQLVKTHDVVSADIGSGATRFGWSWMDQALRVLSGVTPSTNEEVPQRLFDAANISSIDTQGADDAWYGTFDYRSSYLALWSVAGK